MLFFIRLIGQQLSAYSMCSAKCDEEKGFLQTTVFKYFIFACQSGNVYNYSVCWQILFNRVTSSEIMPLTEKDRVCETLDCAKLVLRYRGPCMAYSLHFKRTAAVSVGAAPPLNRRFASFTRK